MRTVVIILLGFVLWGICLGVARLLTGPGGTTPYSTATTVFVALWFVAAGANMWVGVAKAGYSFREELPIFLLIFLVPVVIALAVNWKVFRV